MKHLKLLGWAIVVFAMMGLSGCDSSNSNDDTPSRPTINPPVNPQPPENNTTIPDDNNTTVPDENTTEEPQEPEIEPVDIPVHPEYSVFPVENGAHALTNNGKELVYGSIDGIIYSLDIETGESKYLYDLNADIPNILIGGLAHVEGAVYLYGAAHNSTIRELNIETGESQVLTDGVFPDGIDVFSGMIYSITNNNSDVLTVFNMDGSKRGTISTQVNDMVAIAHSERYLYVLAENSDVYQVDPNTGESRLVVDNYGFEEGDSFGGVEGLDIMDHYIYMTNVNDNSIYRIDVDVRALEQ
jgi:outer membrane protein assembly factor BamB